MEFLYDRDENIHGALTRLTTINLLEVNVQPPEPNRMQYHMKHIKSPSWPVKHEMPPNGPHTRLQLPVFHIRDGLQQLL